MMLKHGHITALDLPRPILPGREDWLELYDFAWELARRHVTEQPGLAAPCFMDEGFDPEKIWQWDTCFMALFCRYAHDLYPGIESLDNFYGAQKADGYIAMSHVLATGEDSYPLPWGRINPPLLSWVEWDYFQVTGDTARLARVLPPLLRYDEWIEKNRRRGDGSYWFADCGSSGMDNSPRTARHDHHGAETGFIDLAAQQALSALSLARIATAAGQAALAETCQQRHRERAAYLNATLWNRRHQFYYDRHTDGNFVNCKTAAAFWPLLAEAAAPEQAAALAAHLEDPREFNRPNPVPSLAYDECNYQDHGGYWLGGVWAPTNYMIIKGLRKNGQRALARRIAVRYLDLLYRVWKNYEPHTLWECYAPEMDAPAINEYGQRCRPDFVGWTGLGPIAMLLEDILGLDIDYPNRVITWHSDILEPHGVDNLRFGPHRISLRAGARRHANDLPEITVDAPCPLEVRFMPATALTKS
jgi:hypothetical protein